MAEAGQHAKGSLLPGVAAVALATAYLIALLAVEKQVLIIGLLALAIAAILAANWLGWLAPVSRSFADREEALGAMAIAAAFAVAAFFHDDHFVLLLVCTVLLYTVATLGLNIQFGYAGVLNFAGASFFGIGAYTSAVLNAHTAVPHLLVLLIGGLIAALIGSLLLLPVLRTRGHYAALVTIAFALLLKTFLEVNDVLGGPQGLQVKGMKILGFQFIDFATHAPEELKRNEHELLQMLGSKKVAPHIGASFDLADAAAALRYVADGKAIGKVVLDIA